jgi:hypothetical protein
MMGPTRIPLIHNRAFGHAAMLPTIASQRSRLSGVPGPTIDGTTIDYQKAQAYYDGARNNFDDLVSLVGESSAKDVITQAKAAYEDALKAWTAAQPTRI